MRLALLLFVVGCTIPERDQAGPVIHIDLQSSFVDVGDTTSMPEFSLNGDAQYSVMVTINTTAGNEMKQDSTSTFPVSNYTATFTVPSVTFPDSPYTSDEFDDKTFTRTNPLVIPASSKGQSLKVHVDATDSRGLASNVLDFSVALK